MCLYVCVSVYVFAYVCECVCQCDTFVCVIVRGFMSLCVLAFVCVNV